MKIKILLSLFLICISLLSFKSGKKYYLLNEYITESSQEFQNFHRVINLRCANCHSDYTFYTEEDWIEQKFIVPGNPYDSKLFSSLRSSHTGGDEDMPPFLALSEVELETIKKYISGLKSKGTILEIDISFPKIDFPSTEKLSETEVFERCFIQLTGERIAQNSKLFREVENGTTTPAKACYQILKEAKFKNRDFNYSNESLSIKTRDQLHRFHTSWIKDYAYYRSGSTYLSHDIFPMDEAALHLTNVLWNGKHYSELLNSKDTLRPIRSARSKNKIHLFFEGREDFNKLKKSVLGNENIKGKTFPWNPKWLPRGHLVNIEAKKSFQSVQYYVNRDTNVTMYNDGLILDKGLHGANGSQSYILNNIGRDPGEKSNGGLVIPRTWAKKVLQDFMCRKLPVIKVEDALSYVQKNSTIKFRAKSSCMQCHTTIDPMSGAIRHSQVVYTNTTGRTSIHVKFHKETMRSLNDLFPDRDDKFYLRPTKGRFIYRTIMGKLINKEFSSLEDLNKIITSTDDYYTCAASKYFYYMTGISVELENIKQSYGDIDDNSKYLIGEVIALGKKLKAHGDVKQLIRDIIKMEIYKQDNFGDL